MAGLCGLDFRLVLEELLTKVSNLYSNHWSEAEKEKPIPVTLHEYNW